MVEFGFTHVVADSNVVAPLNHPESKTSVMGKLLNPRSKR